jgi:hypothetical protein
VNEKRPLRRGQADHGSAASSGPVRPRMKSRMAFVLAR